MESSGGEQREGSERTGPAPSREQAAAALGDATAARAGLAGAVSFPAGFSTTIGVAVAVQIATAAAGIAGAPIWVLIAGVLVFGVVATLELARFERRNGVRVGGLASRVVLGTGALGTATYAAAFAVAVWGALGGAWWLTAAASAAGGAGYALAGRRWLRTYRAAPDVHGRGEPAWLLLALAAVAAAGLVVLALGA